MSYTGHYCIGMAADVGPCKRFQGYHSKSICLPGTRSLIRKKYYGAKSAIVPMVNDLNEKAAASVAFFIMDATEEDMRDGEYVL